jgi:hypothetical protein
MGSNVYKTLAEFLPGMSDEKKEGILLGIELMGNQTEKWLDNHRQALHFRNDRKQVCGFSGWMETYEHTAGFIFAEDPTKDPFKLWSEDGIECGWPPASSLGVYDAASESSDMELTDGEDEVKQKRRAFLYKYIFGALSDDDEDDVGCDIDHLVKLHEDYMDELDEDDYEEDEDDYEEDEEEEEEEEDDEYDEWDNITYDGVAYLVGPDKDTKYSVIDGATYARVGVLASMHSVEKDITFEDNVAYENHMKKARETKVPHNGEEAVKFIRKFIKNNYQDRFICKPCSNDEWFRFVNYRDTLLGGSHREFILENHTRSIRSRNEIGILTSVIGGSDFGWTTPFGKSRTRKMYDPRGKKMGEVMKEIEKAL